MRAETFYCGVCGRKRVEKDVINSHLKTPCNLKEIVARKIDNKLPPRNFQQEQQPNVGLMAGGLMNNNGKFEQNRLNINYFHQQKNDNKDPLAQVSKDDYKSF